MTTISFEENVGIKKKKFKNLETFFVYLEEKDLYPPSEKRLSAKEFEAELQKDCEEARNAPPSRFKKKLEDKKLSKAVRQDSGESIHWEKLSEKSLSFWEHSSNDAYGKML
ncbi:hypothetical protein K9L63_00990 [Candidatus Gracilibacteria bacterium]|nr:hypothetical protein [Candidatus Gracilibacteria bacterium]